MDKGLPDKWIRKAVYDAVNGIVVGGVQIPCYDSRVTGKNISSYILLTTQTNTVDDSIKCGNMWESSILIDIVTRYDLNTNNGSRVLADNILDNVRAATNNLTLDTDSNLEIQKQKQNFPNDIVSESKNEIIFRKLMRIELTIN